MVMCVSIQDFGCCYGDDIHQHSIAQEATKVWDLLQMPDIITAAGGGILICASVMTTYTKHTLMRKQPAGNLERLRSKC